MDEIQFLTEEHICLIHNNTVEEFGGDLGKYIDTDSKISSILSQQYPVFGYDKYPSIFDKAAMLLYFFVKGHCFVDGNKRVAMQSAIVFLIINGCEDYMDNQEGYDITMKVAESQFRGEQIDYCIKQLSEWFSLRFLNI